MKVACLWAAIVVVAGITAAFVIGPANANAIVLSFPGTGTTYTSFANGSGSIPSGGESAALFTAGDNVEQSFSGTGLASVNSLDVSFDVNDFLDGASEDVLISINGTNVGSFSVPDSAGSGGLLTFSGSLFFSPIFGNGTYDLMMTLVDSVPVGDGGIAFEDGGNFALNGGVRVVGIPEPLTLALVCGGLCATIVARRPRKRMTA